MRAYGGVKDTSMILLSRHKTEASVQLHTPAALLPGKQTAVSAQQERLSGT
jgi:hypothetical protein